MLAAPGFLLKERQEAIPSSLVAGQIKWPVICQAILPQ
jgi:hypothetical protein